MPDEPIVAPGEQAEPVQSPQEPEQPVQDIQEPGELEVLRGQVSNLEKVLGEQGKTIGDLKNDNAFLRSQQPQMGNQGQVAGNQPVYPQSPQQGSPVGNAPEYDPYDTESVKAYNAYQQKLLDDKLNRFAVWQQQSQVGSSLSRGQQVIQQNPAYFKGIETETINMVNNLVQSSPNIPAATLENPTTWYGVADMIRGEKARQTTPPVNPVSSTAIDTPAPVRPNEPEKQIDMGIAQELVDEFYGGDRELATKSARASRERGEK